MNKRFWAIIVVIIAIFAGVIWANSNKQGSSTATTVQPTSHLRGDTSSKVKFVEYGDFECPYCGEYYPIVEQVYQKYQDTVSFQFRNLPLTQIHPNAFAAARAAEAASNQGKFWQMYAILYEQNAAYYNSNDKLTTWVGSSNPETYFVEYAQQLDLNTSKFESDYSSAQVDNAINADMAAFNKTGLQEATPTFLLNGKQITATSLASFSKLIDAELKKENP